MRAQHAFGLDVRYFLFEQYIIDWYFLNDILMIPKVASFKTL